MIEFRKGKSVAVKLLMKIAQQSVVTPDMRTMAEKAMKYLGLDPDEIKYVFKEMGMEGQNDKK